MTIVAIILSSVYLIILLTGMFMGENDIINKMVVTNSFGPGQREVNIVQQTKFMPHLEIVQGSWEQPNSAFDVWNKNISEDALDSEKLKNYIEVMLHIQIRKPKETIHILRPFRNCRVSDFINKNYEPDEYFAEQLKQRNLCPDVHTDDEFYKVESKYSNMTFR